MNKHGLKLKHKNMIGHLSELNTQKDKAQRYLDKLTHMVAKLEKAKNDCAKRIKEK